MSGSEIEKMPVGLDNQAESNVEATHERVVEQYEYMMEKDYSKNIKSMLEGEFNIRFGDKTYNLYTFIDLLHKLRSENKGLRALDYSIQFYEEVATHIGILKVRLRQIIVKQEQLFRGEKKACEIALKEKNLLEAKNNELMAQIQELKTSYEVLKYKHDNPPMTTKEGAGVPLETEIFSETKKITDGWKTILKRKVREKRTLRDKGQLEDKQKLFPKHVIAAIRQTIEYKLMNKDGKDANELALRIYDEVKNELLEVGELSEGDYDR